MRICMPTMGKNGLNEMVYNHFGSAAFFSIYDTDTNKLEFVKNQNEHHNHGTCQPLGAIADSNVDVILTSGMGRRAVEMLNNGGIKVYLLAGNTVLEAINNFEKNILQELTFENACGGHGCH